MQKPPNFCQQEKIPINNYTANIVQSKLFEDVPSLYMATYHYYDRCAKCSVQICLFVLGTHLMAIQAEVANSTQPHLPLIRGPHMLSRDTWSQGEDTPLPDYLLSHLTALDTLWVSPLSCPSTQHLYQNSHLGSTSQELTSYNHRHISVKFKGIQPFSSKIFEGFGECQLLSRNGS